MIQYAKANPHKKYLVISECDLTAPLKEACPDTDFNTPCKFCPFMKKNDLGSFLRTMREEIYEVTVGKSIEGRANGAQTRMFELTEGLR